MKIAVASIGDIIADHFGHCKNFNIFETDKDKITKETNIKNPGHKPGFCLTFLADKGISVIISGGMGGGAVDILKKGKLKLLSLLKETQEKR